MHYTEILPSVHLRESIKCFWTLEQTNINHSHAPEPVLPDGRMELIFNLADSFKRYHSDGTAEIQPTTLVVGQTLQSTTIEPLGKINLFGVRFQTAGAQVFFDFSLNELTDKIENLPSVLGAKGKQIEDQIIHSISTQNRIALTEKLIIEKMRSKNRFDEAIAHAAKIIETTNGLISVEKLSKVVGVVSRQLERKFQKHIGISPKSLCRINRIQTVLNVMKSKQIESWADLTMDFGYFDQAHFIRDFKSFTGKTPMVYLADNNQLTDIFTGL